MMINWLGFSARWWRSFTQFVGLFSVCLLLAVSCGGGTSSSDSADSGTSTTDSQRITIGTTQTIRTVDPADAYELLSGVLLQNMGDRLYAYKPGTTELEPQLATAMPTISEDGLTYTIPLREDVTFHDGTPFNAEAMAFSIQRFMESDGRPSFLLADRIESIEATGDYELTIKLTAPFAAFTPLLAFSGMTPVPPGSYEMGADALKPDSFIGTGPYTLAELTSDRVRLDPFDNYWGDAPANEGIDIQILTSPVNLFNAFQTNGIDISYQTLDPDQVKSLESNAEANNWQVITAGGNVINYLTLNQKIEPFNDVKVRQAIAALIDRPLLSERVFQGQAEPLYSLIPPTFEASEPVFQDMYGDANTEKAKELLEAAGYSESNPLSFQIWYLSSSTTDGLAANTIKASMEQQLPGMITVEVNNVEAATAFDKLSEGLYPSFILNWYPDFFDPDTYIHPFLHCETSTSDQKLCQDGQTQLAGSFYYSDRANELIDQERQAVDEATRDVALKDLQTLMAEDVPHVPLWVEKDYIFAQGNVQNLEIQPTQQVLFWQISKT